MDMVVVLEAGVLVQVGILVTAVQAQVTRAVAVEAEINMYLYKFSVAVAVLIYNLTILIGTVYLVGWQGWSGWWFLLAALLLASFKSDDKDKDTDD